MKKKGIVKKGISLSIPRWHSFLVHTMLQHHQLQTQSAPLQPLEMLASPSQPLCLYKQSDPQTSPATFQ